MDRTSGDTFIRRAMELINRLSLYIGMNLWNLVADACGCGTCTKCTPSIAARGLASRPKNRPAHPIEGVIGSPSGTSSTPIFRFFALFRPFLKKFFAELARHCPPCAESPRRALAPFKNRGIPRQNRPFAPRRRLKIPRNTPLQSPKTPNPHTPPHKKVE